MNFRRRHRRGPWKLVAIAMVMLLLVVVKFLFDRYTTTVSGMVVDDYSNEPLAGVVVQCGGLSASTDAKGEYQLVGVNRSMPEIPLAFTAAGYARTEAPVAWTKVDVRLRPDAVSGIVHAANGQPIPGAWVVVGKTEAVTDAMGAFTLQGVPDNPHVIVGAPGYRTVQLDPGRDLRLDVQMEEMANRGIYVSFGLLGLPQQRDALFRRAKTLGVNTLVIDVKSDRGLMNVAVAPPQAAPAAVLPYPENFEEVISRLKAEGWYLVARIVAFKDNPMAAAVPDLAIKGTRGVYFDCESQRWLDPYSKQVWEYNIGIAERAVKSGFDEVQFDYVRFPIECVQEALIYSQEDTTESENKAVEDFLSVARTRLHAMGAAISVDVFGLAAVEQDIGIGQVLEGVAKSVDYVSPIVYPSTWRAGSFNSDYPPADPYRIVNLSVKQAVDRLRVAAPAKVRPWLQAYDDYQRRNLVYGTRQITDQVKASNDAGAQGWMLWDPFGAYRVTGDLANPE